MPPPSQRRVVLTVGADRSGAGLLTAVLSTLGMPVAEPRWVADLHRELLQRCGVQVHDARPSAWFETGKRAAFEPLRERVRARIAQQLDDGQELVVHDPALVWFAGLWRSAAVRCDARPAYVAVLRPPAEVVAAAGGEPAGPVQRTAAWLNLALHTERATRGSERVFVRHGDLLADWTVPVLDLGKRLDLAAVQEAGANQVRAVHALVDPDRRRPPVGWDDLAVPPRLRDLAQATWEELDRLADPAGDEPAVQHALDELRAAYAAVYAEAEAIAHSTTLAAHGTGLATLPAPVNAVVTRGADRVPHGLRAIVPPTARRAVRRAIRRTR